jgi:Ca2+ transporting ATPase
LTKGGAEVIMEKCDYILNANGVPELLTEERKKDILDTVVLPMASEGLRTICVAYKDILTSTERSESNEEIRAERPNFDAEQEIVSGLTCLAIFGIEDPVRPEVPAAIAQCRKAGVTVRMVTGDNVVTAKSIALKCGIITPADEARGTTVLEGEEFNRKIRSGNGKVDQSRFDAVWPKLRVLARSTPQDKYTLVEGIINSRIGKYREVVAVTGDGTNDAPALKKADIGFAMGIAGTDVAKEASDIILTDDNFISIVKACMWGRNIYDNICKFLQFQLTVNFAALIMTIVTAAIDGNTPLKAVPMLWINLIQDTLASLALATEPPSDHLLNRKPYGRKSRILSGVMFRNIVGQGCYQLIVMFLLVFGRAKGMFDFLNPGKIPTDGKEDVEWNTMIFNVFVMMTIFNLINSRCIANERNVFARFFRNPVYLAIICLMAGTQAVVVNVGGQAFRSAPLNWQEWVACIVMGFGSLIWYQLLVFIPTKGFLSKIKHSVKKDYNLTKA